MKNSQLFFLISVLFCISAGFHEIVGQIISGLISGACYSQARDLAKKND